MPTSSSSGTRRVARWIGSEVPAGNFGFRVHSAFGAALNLELTGRRFVVSLVGPDADAFPQSIRLVNPERFDGWPVAAGARGRCEGDVLRFEHPRGRRLPWIDLTAAVRSRREPPPYLDAGDDAERESWRECAALLGTFQAGRATDLRLAALLGAPAPPTALAARLVPAAADLASAIRARNVEAAGAAAARLIGLGTGLTPTGDDFLCGLFAALWCASREGGASRRFVIEWGARLAPRLEATHAISATFLQCAIDGCFSGALTDLAAAFQRCRRGDAASGPRRALRALCAMGHSSGMDTATGFLFGLWLRTDEEMRRYAA